MGYGQNYTSDLFHNEMIKYEREHKIRPRRDTRENRQRERGQINVDSKGKREKKREVQINVGGKKKRVREEKRKKR